MGKMWRGTLTVVLLLAAVVAAAEAPRQVVGAYSVGVERVARVRDLERPVGMQARTTITVFVEAKTPEELERVVDMCREPTASDDTRHKLSLCQTTPGASARKHRKYLEVSFTGTRLGATQLREFQGALVCYESKRPYQFEVGASPGEEEELSGTRLSVEFLGPGRDDAGKECLVLRLALSFPRGEAAPAVEEWQDHKLVVVDGEGSPAAPFSVAHQYQYDGNRRLTGIGITGYFDLALAGRDPQAVQYSVQQLVGLQALSYRFANLPLP